MVYARIVYKDGRTVLTDAKDYPALWESLDTDMIEEIHAHIGSPREIRQGKAKNQEVTKE